MNQDKNCCGGKPAENQLDSKVDPVCGMHVDPVTARNKIEHENNKYYFCCPNCLKKFVAEPEQFVKSQS